MIQEIGDLTDRLKPADGATIAKHLLSLRKAGMAIPNDMKPEDLEAVYSYALSEVPAFGLRRAVEKIIKGEYQIKYGFMPLPPELAAMARAEARVLREDLVRLREKQAALSEIAKGKSKEPDKQSVERIKDMLSRFRVAHQEAREARNGMVNHEPISPEKEDMLTRIMDMPDAKSVTAEQAAYRRKVAAELQQGDET